MLITQSPEGECEGIGHVGMYDSLFVCKRASQTIAPIDILHKKEYTRDSVLLWDYAGLDPNMDSRMY